MGLVTSLRADHETLRALLARLESPRVPEADVSTLLGRLILMLGEHEERERRLLLPALRQALPAASRVLDRVDGEHSRLVRMLIDAHDRFLSPKHPARVAAKALRPLIATLREHMDREESDLYPLAESGLTSEEREQLDRDADAAYR